MNIAMIYDINTPYTTGVYFDRSFRELGFNVDRYSHENVNSVPEGYDLYFVCDSGPTYDIPKWKSGISIYYAIDTHLEFESRFKMAKTATVPVMAQLTCGAQRATDRGLETLWIPLGCDPWIHQDYQLERDLEVAFVGNLYLDDDWRQTIKQKLLNHGFTDEQIFVGTASKEEMGKIYSRAKIVLNHSVRENKLDISMRFFEAISSGAYLLTQKLAHNDTDKIIDPKLYSTYTNDEEMFKQIDEILKNWPEHYATAQKAKLFIRTFHTYTRHLESLLKNLARPKEENGQSSVHNQNS